MSVNQDLRMISGLRPCPRADFIAVVIRHTKTGSMFLLGDHRLEPGDRVLARMHLETVYVGTFADLGGRPYLQVKLDDREAFVHCDDALFGLMLLSSYRPAVEP